MRRTSKWRGFSLLFISLYTLWVSMSNRVNQNESAAMSWKKECEKLQVFFNFSFNFLGNYRKILETPERNRRDIFDL